MFTDLRHALRLLAKSPGFTAVAVLTLGLGIGACTAVFSIVNSLVLRPLPYAQPQQLVQLWEDSRGDGTGRNTVAGGVLKGWQDQTTLLEGVAAITPTSANLTGSGRPVRLRGLQVSTNYLHLLRLPPALGRDFLPDEGQAGHNNVVILSQAAWRNCFDADARVVGQTIQLNGQARTVIGVLAPAARLTDEVDFLMPFAFGTPGWNRTFAGHNLMAIARLQPAATIDQVRQEMAAITEHQRSSYPSFKQHWGVIVVPLHEQVTGKLRPQLLLLFGATACVLLIACANVAGLLLARAVSRSREIALRLTLGASRTSVVRMVLIENLLLAAGGGVLGVLLAHWSVAGFEAWRPAELVAGLPVTVDGRALAFAVAAALVSGLTAGLVPAWRLARTGYDELKGGSRATESGAHARTRGVLVVGQIALSLVLLIGAGLLLKSLLRFQAVPLGFEPSGVLLADLTLSPEIFGDAARRAPYLAAIEQRVAALPGVESTGIASILPLESSYTEGVRAEGTTAPELTTIINFVSGHYLETMRIPLLAGRPLAPSDNRPDAAPTIMINAHLATQLFGAANPIGRSVRLLGQNYEVVGITGDVLAWGVEEGPVALAYLPEALAGRFIYRRASCCLIVRSATPPLALAKSVQAAVLAAAPDQPLSNLRTYGQVIMERTFARRLMLGLLGLFAGVALGLAALGLYGILAFSVEQRTHELGIRSALGASARNLFLLVITGGLKLTAAGLVLGLLGSLWLSRLIAGYLFGVTATDPFTLVGVSLLLIAIAVLATWLPARRATRVDPLVALRAE